MAYHRFLDNNKLLTRFLLINPQMGIRGGWIPLQIYLRVIEFNEPDCYWNLSRWMFMHYTFDTSKLITPCNPKELLINLLTRLDISVCVYYLIYLRKYYFFPSIIFLYIHIKERTKLTRINNEMINFIFNPVFITSWIHVFEIDTLMLFSTVCLMYIDLGTRDIFINRICSQRGLKSLSTIIEEIVV